MHPDKRNVCLDVYADTDFDRLFTSEDKYYPVSMKSRTGILLTFSNAPIIWSSKLQS